MKVQIVTNMVPFIWGGAEELSFNLHARLLASGVDSELVRIPFYWEPYKRLEQEIAFCRMLQSTQSDLVIGMKFPAYHIQARRKVLWLIHQYRQAYDLFDSAFTNIPNDAEGLAVRRLVKRHDDSTFQSVDRIFSISEVVAERLLHFNGFESQVLRAPINDPELFDGGQSQGYILAAGRVNGAKRQTLLIDAITRLKHARLIIAGPPDSAADADDLIRRVAESGVQDRITLDLRFMSRVEVASYVNGAAAIAYLPFQEDSYGYVTMEAFEAGKPVITTNDSGEVQLIVIDGITGFVVPPSAETLADAIAKITDDAAGAERLGAAGRDLWRSKNINWKHHIEHLLS